MENLSNVDDPNEKPHPKPTDDPGAQIETVTPDSQKESLQNDQRSPRGNESATDADINENIVPKRQEDNNESAHTEIETVSANTENEDFPDDQEGVPKDIVDSPENDVEDTNSPSKDPEVSNDKNDEDSAGVETVTPS